MLLIGNDPTNEHPLLAWQIRNNVRLHRSRLYVANSQEIMSYRVLLPVRSRWRFARWLPYAARFAIAFGLFYWSLSCMVTLDIRPFTYFAF